jgi:enterochelin esterase-like enzyme
MKEAGFEFIVVGVNARNKLGGSFGVNSPVTGNWEDFIVKDVVEHVDSNYRTIAKPDSRGIAGWSMGGFVAINLGLKHPDLFSVVYGLAPGLFDENGLVEAMETWDSMFLTAYGAAFAPEPTKDFPHSSTPKFSNTKSDNLIRGKWENGFGNLKQKIDAYLQLQTPLKAIQIVYGDSDSYPWIPKGCKYFAELLNENNVAHELIECPGGHDLRLIRNSFAPFFANNLNSEEVETEAKKEATEKDGERNS